MKEVSAYVENLESRQLLANIHFIGTPTTVIHDRTIDVSFTVAGIGNQPLDIQLATEGVADVAIHNPGGNDPPGQQVPFVFVTTDFTRVDNKNGTTTFTASLTITDEMILQSVKLKQNWTATVESFTITDTTVTIKQGKQILTF